MNNQYVIPAGYKKWSAGLMIAGVLTLVLGFILFSPFSAPHGTSSNNTRFWAVLLQNSLYWLMLVNVATFFIAICTLAMGGWQAAFRRVAEAIGSVVPVMGVITMVVLICLIVGDRTDIYHWLDADAVANDHILNHKKGFLNPVVYLVGSIVSIALWAFLGKKLGQVSIDTDNAGTLDYQSSRSWLAKNMKLSAWFLVVYLLTVGSIMPWLWLMSIDAHWYSTMYSWYTFASTFVAGVALLTLFVIYFKNQGQLPFVTKEHINDLGKFIFGFSIFWTYLWFAQFMLIWYANIPEETVYFKVRLQGPFRGLFYLNLVINFVAPLLIFMKKSTKRNYTIVTFVCVLIIAGHWVDFYQMVMPGTLGNDAQISWFELGIPLGFVGVIMWGVSRFANRVPMTAKNNPFLKESIIHQV